MRICPSCGVEVADSAKFCRRCGTKMPAAEPEAPEQESPEQEEMTGTDQPLQVEQEAPAFEGTDYQWGPPTGGENDDEQAMPAGLVGEAEQQEQQETAQSSPYTYRLDAPGWDHTSDFKEEDISRNKVIAMAAYMLGAIGVVIALIAGKDSPYADFHMRQGLKIAIIEAVLAVISVLLCWTLIVPGAAAICMIILMVVRLICFVSVCKGKAVEPPILRSFGFLK